ncbi:MAG: T9SS type A sorting domain-containing protein, partial [Bacteroidales bacterium]
PSDKYTTIPVNLSRPLDLRFALYDITGKQVFVRENSLPAGENQIRIKVESLSPGMYFYRLTAEGESASGKLIIQR